MKKNFITTVLLFSCLRIFAQHTQESPISWGLNLDDYDVPTHTSPALNMTKVADDDAKREQEGKVPHFAKFVPALLNLQNSGLWQDLPDGARLWRLRVHAEQALGIVLYFNDFYMPNGSKFFVYTPDKLDVFGAYTSINNTPDGYFASSLTLSDECILEYYEPAKVRNQGRIQVYNISHAYRDIPSRTPWAAKMGTSGSCNVNVACTPEGTDWQDEKRAVVRLLTAASGGSAFCTGALVNNARQDCKPYILSANHCIDSDAAADYSQLTVQFNYEATTCTSTTPVSTTQIVSGATFRARAGNTGVSGGDFNLFEMNNAIPTAYNPYYAGWNASATASPSGVSIHHPSGDLKKISTYNTTLTTVAYGGGAGTTHWQANWVPTTNGHGITEGGSSGSPLFNNVGQIVGDLSGGPSSCTATNKLDYYGKVSYNWLNNGATAANRRLKDWLDPDNTGTLSINGTNAPCTGVLVAIDPDTLSVCRGATAATTVTVTISGTMTVNLSASGLGAGVTAAFAPNTLTSTGNSTLTFTAAAGATLGNQTITVTATSGATTVTKTILLVVASGAPTTVLNTPANNATALSNNPTLTWTATPSVGATYQIQVATNNTFTNIVATASNLTTNTYTVTPALANATTYYWRVRSTNSCGAGAYSSTFSFTTGNTICTTVAATGLPLAIPDNNPTGLTSTINFTGVGTITDVNVLNLVGTHTYISDLTFTLFSPANTSVVLFDGICTTNDNFNLSLDDAATTTIPCPPTGGGTHTPANSLNVYNGQAAAGNWALKIVDAQAQDIGNLNSWSLNVCYLGVVCTVTATTSKTNVACFGGNTGSATVTAASGTSPYTYLWSNNATTATINNLIAGTYTVTVTDASSCKVTATAVITQPTAALTVSASSTNASTGNNGTATATATGGTSPYTYLWSNTATTAAINNLSAGTYTVTVMDTNGCTATASTNVQNTTTNLTISLSSTNVTCAGACNGTATVTPANGAVPYTYRWSNAFTSSTISGLCPNTYTVTVTDAAGTTATGSVSIIEPAALSATVNSVNLSCFGANNAAAGVTVTGGTLPYAYRWSNNATTTTINALTAGTYTITVTDANGCTISRTATISQPTALNTSNTVVNVSCFGGNNGAINTTTTGGTPPYTYRWTNGATTRNIGNLIAGTYTVTVTDNNACTSVSSITVLQPNTALTVSVAATSINSAAATVAGGTAPYNYAWSNGATTSTISGVVPGTYIVTVTDFAGCTATASSPISVQNSIPDLTKFDVLPNPTNGLFHVLIGFNQEEELNIAILAVNGQLIRSQTLSAQQIVLPIDLSPQANGVYIIRLTTAKGTSSRRVVKY